MSILDGASRTVEERFWVKVEPDVDGHWIWTGAVTGNGYPNFRLGYGRYAAPQRVAWELQRGPLPEGRIRNECGVGLCVNPEHWSVEKA